jgi:hypothetical protein
MSDQTDLARGWLRKSCSDLAAARRILSGEDPYDTACFHLGDAMGKLVANHIESNLPMSD